MNKEFMKETKADLWDITVETEQLIEELKKEMETADDAKKAELQSKISELTTGIFGIKGLSFALENSYNQQALRIAEAKSKGNNISEELEVEKVEENVATEEAVNEEVVEEVKEEVAAEKEEVKDEAETTEPEEVEETKEEEVVAEAPVEEDTKTEETPNEEEVKEEVVAEAPVAESPEDLNSETTEEVVSEEKSEEAVEEKTEEKEEAKEELPASDVVVSLPVVEETKDQAETTEQPKEATTDGKEYVKESLTEDRGVLINQSQGVNLRESFDSQNALEATINKNDAVAEGPIVEVPVDTAEAAPKEEASPEEELEKMTQEYSEALASGNEEKANELQNAISEKKKTLQKVA